MAAISKNSGDGSGLHLSFVGRRTVDGGNRLVVKPKIHRELPAVMREMIERVTNHYIPRRLLHQLSSSQQLPLLHQVIVVGALQRLAALCDGVIECGRQLFPGLRLRRLWTS